jgi:TldD protein
VWSERLAAVQRGLGRRARRLQLVRTRIDRIAAHHDGTHRAWTEERVAVELVARDGLVDAGALDIEAIDAELDQLERARRARRGGVAGTMPVVLAPGEGAVLLHEIVGHALEADQAMNTPLLAPGRKVAIPALTVRDRGDGPDDEGTPARTVVLIARGVVAGMMHDRLTAAIAGGTSTGNGRRCDFRTPAQPRMRALEIAAGKESADALMSDLARGLYVERFRHARVDLREGRFTIDVELARDIRRGRLGTTRRDLRLTGAVLPTLAAIEAIGRDVRSCAQTIWCGKGDVVATRLAGPTIRLAPIEVES